jgi:hypothetical protein
MMPLFMLTVGLVFAPTTATATGSSGSNTVTVSALLSFAAGQVISFVGCPGTYTISAAVSFILTVSPALACTLSGNVVNLARLTTIPTPDIGDY